MPTLSERQLLIQNVLLETERDLDEYMAEGLLDDDDDMDLDHRNESDDNSDTSDTSSTSSDSSSCSSDSSGSDASMHSAISDDDEDEVYAAKMSASGELLQVILETRVLSPHKVAKASQLHLVLVEFKEGDPKRFRRNLRVSLETFDELVLRIQNHAIFSNNSRHPQTPPYIQLAITLFRFGHDGNTASVESIAQYLNAPNKMCCFNYQPSEVLSDGPATGVSPENPEVWNWALRFWASCHANGVVGLEDDRGSWRLYQSGMPVLTSNAMELIIPSSIPVVLEDIDRPGLGNNGGYEMGSGR
ncbi:hypothetical protein DFH07DRAFT_953371 [Mycena maculata]|uniref:Uncharacterized protein n=1 Tax=Mycena maculata TaxID=230809 RepID=A0AAD7JUT8_9AGAR|nr:hypothetical protein DFH07DRAFT_953371 [Mycena maculata]